MLEPSQISRVLVIYTGGTIGMKAGPRGYVPVPHHLRELLRSIPQFHDHSVENPTKHEFLMPPSRIKTRVAFDVLEYNPLRDSSNLDMKDWGVIAEDIEKNYEEYDAFVVLHGTDTMAFTASALSFMLQNLARTVIITGSQIPLTELRNDAIDNLLGSLLIAGNFEIPEVCLFFDNKLFRGNRATKFNADGFNAFHSGNLRPLVEVGIHVKVHWTSILTPPRSGVFRAQKSMDPNVGILRLFPGITPHFIRNFTQPPLKGLVLQTYGAGNAPDTNLEFLAALHEASSRGIVIVNCTQCHKGAVEASYATGQALAEVGVVSGRDMTVEAALTKLSYLFAQGLTPTEIKRKLQRNLRGELTEARRSLQLSFKDNDLVRSVAKTIGREASSLPSSLVPMMLCAFAAAGDLQQLRQMVEMGADVRATDYDRRSALHLAAAEGHVHVVDFLLETGANLNALDRWGRTPLREAVRFGQDEVALLLREQGGQLFIHQLAPHLCASAMHGDLPTLRRLISYGADINASDYDRRTALHLAAAEGHAHVVEYLLQQGAQSNPLDRWKQTPLFEAIRNQHQQVAELLHQHGGRIPSGTLELELLDAVLQNELPRLEFLIQFGGELQTRNADEQTLLHLACKCGHVGLVGWLCEQGVDLQARDRFQYTPLLVALQEEHIEIAEFLYARGARLNPSLAKQLLLTAIQEERTSQVQRLLRFGADPNSQDEQHMSALHHAVLRSHEHQVGLLLDAGANPRLLNLAGFSPLHLAIEQGHLAISEILRTRSGELHESVAIESLFEAAKHNDRTQLLRWQRFGISLFSRDREERTLLHIAASYGHRGLAEWLLEHGLKQDDVDIWGRTATDYARTFGNHAMLELWEE